MSAEPGQRAIVKGHGMATINGTATHYDGEEAEATLIKRIGGENSTVWFVQFDNDPEGVTRCRRLVRTV